MAYYYEPEIGNYYYGHGHPMKPHRVRMAHTLIVRYGLYRHLEVRGLLACHSHSVNEQIMMAVIES